MTPNGSDRKEGRTLLFGVETEVKDCIQIDRQKEWKEFILDMTPNGSDRKEGRTLLFGVETEVKEKKTIPRREFLFAL
jgi:hypothetical protein